MPTRRAIAATAAWLIVGCAAAQQPVPTIDEILAHVQSHTGQFEKSLPDFVCDERIVSRYLRRGQVVESVTAESHFTGLQKKSGTSSFTEARELVTVGRKPAAKGQALQGPFLYGGGFSSLLDQTFAAKNTPFHDYRLANEGAFAGRPRPLIVHFATKPDQQALHYEIQGMVLLQRDTGTAWIDANTLQVLRLERHFLNVPKGQSELIVTVEYGPVQIEGKPFWMPLSVHASQFNAGQGLGGEYSARYRNYRKFDVTSGIAY